MRYLRTNTAVRLTVGPFLDKTDGVTPEVALTVTACKLTFMVDDGNVPTLVLDVAPTASGGANDMVHVTGDDAGFYDLELAAANVNYLGRAMLAITDAATHCPVFHEFMILPAVVYDAMVLGTDLFDVSVTQWLGTAVATPGTAGVPSVDTVRQGGTTQTGRDLGASVLLSPGTGTGQLDITSGVVKANLAQILGTALTETGGQIAAAFKQFFDVATPTGTMKAITNVVTATNLTNAATAGDFNATQKTSLNAATPAVTVSDKTGFSLSAAGVLAIWHQLTSGIVTASTIGKLLTDNVNATVSSRSSHTAADVWAATTRLLSAGTNIVLAKGTGVTGFNDLSAAQVNAEADTALADYDGPTNAELATALAALNDVSVADILAGAYESTETVQDFLRLVRSVLLGKVSGAGTTTITFEARDGTTDRVVATVDADGNRSAVTVTP